MKKYLITGASGLLGITLALKLATEAEVVGVVHRHPLRHIPFRVVSFDLSSGGAVEQLVAEEKPDVVINCAALTNIDDCEQKPELAYRLNATLPGRLAAITEEMEVKLLHVSTDAVFDGRTGGYNELDMPNPVNLYGHTKLAGEQAVEDHNPDALVARVNFFGWSVTGERSLAEWFLSGLMAGNSLKGFTDVFFCPLMVNHLAKYLIRMIQDGLSGIYHVVSREHLSKYEFGCRIARRFGRDEKLIQRASWTTGLLKAGRSPNLTLSTDKLTLALGEQMPGIDEGIDAFYQLGLEKYPQRLRSFAA